MGEAGSPDDQVLARAMRKILAAGYNQCIDLDSGLFDLRVGDYGSQGFTEEELAVLRRVGGDSAGYTPNR